MLHDVKSDSELNLSVLAESLTLMSAEEENGSDGGGVGL